jgi:E3 ubiquitin-protein ligase MARCH5
LTVILFRDRECWICHLSDKDEEEGSDDEWIEPCNCVGTSRFVHQWCLQRWIDVESVNTQCRQCLYKYDIVKPDANLLVRTLEPIDNMMNRLAPTGVSLMAFCGAYGLALTYGISTVVITFGSREGAAVIEQMKPEMLCIAIPCIPVGLILCKMCHWEECILRSWRRDYHKTYVFRLLGMPRPPTRTRPDLEKLLSIDGSQSEFRANTRTICSALLLPTVSALVGRALYSNVSPIIKRTLYGAITYMAVKGLAKIYLREYQFLIHADRRALNKQKTWKAMNVEDS